MEISSEVQIKAKELVKILTMYKGSFAPVMDIPAAEEILLLDFSKANHALLNFDIENTWHFNAFILANLEDKKTKIGLGGYLEHRVIYRRSDLFQGENSRYIHLGIDIWAPAFSRVYAPLDGVVHSFKDCAAFGDYGPVIILEHALENLRFYTLYGHLSKRSLEKVAFGQSIRKGQNFTELGPFPENGDWPPHLHFQIILGMEGRSGDFPGVAAPSEIEKYKMLCPDPNLILNISALDHSTAS